MPDALQALSRSHTAPIGGVSQVDSPRDRGSYAILRGRFKEHHAKLPSNTEILTLVSTRRLMNTDASLILPTPEPGRI